MKLSFNVFGIEVSSIKFEELHKGADLVEKVVDAAASQVEKRGKRLVGKAIDGFSSKWMKAWTWK